MPKAILAVLLGLATAAPAQTADLLVINARVWTGDAARPAAEAVAVAGTRILDVGSTAAMLAHKGAATQVIDVHGQRLVPGFNDAHTHFENATQWFYEARLMDVADQPRMIERLRAATARVPKGMWITGTDWGGLAMRAAWRKGDKAFTAFVPDLAAIDAASPDHPVMFRRHDGAVFANSYALRLLRDTPGKPDPTAGAYVKDASGRLTGLITGTAAVTAWSCLPPPSRARTRIAARLLIAELNSYGITSIGDIARIDALSQEWTPQVDMERSASDMRIFTDLRDRGELNIRVAPLLSLGTWAGLKGAGIRPRTGDDHIRYSSLKTFLDGSLMDAPYANRPGYAGDFTYRVVDPEQIRRDIIAADREGWDTGAHQIGDKATRLFLDWEQQAIAANPPRDRRIRLIHLWYPSPADVARAGRLGAFAEITPWHLIREGDGTDALLGPDRANSAFAWASFARAGIRINLVSDWPGSYDKINISPVQPLLNIYMAVTRRSYEPGAPPAWHPQEGLTIEQALVAYTVNPADTVHELPVKGTVTPGKLADLVLLSDDILDPAFTADPAKLLSVRVVTTWLGGRIVYQAR